MTTTEVEFQGQIFEVRRLGTRFVSFYSRSESPTAYLTVEHRAEGPARKGSWQSPAMKAVWHYRGYVAVTED